MVTTQTIRKLFGSDVFTNKGVHVGRIVDCKVDLDKFRVESIVMDVSRGSFLHEMIGGKRGVIVPYGHVEAVGDVVLIRHINTPSIPEDRPEEQSPMSMF